MVNPFELLHELHFRERRVRVLQRHLLDRLPAEGSVLDVGCGDGSLAGGIASARPGLRVEGIDVLERPRTRIPVTTFDGHHIPFPDRSFDAICFVDVLHHAEDPAGLLAEGVRAAKSCVVVKDHLREGALAGPTLRFMDRVGNARHGVPLPYNYWTRAQWTAAFERLGVAARSWSERLGLYPWPLRPLLERSLHFVARLERDDG